MRVAAVAWPSAVVGFLCLSVAAAAQGPAPFAISTVRFQGNEATDSTWMGLYLKWDAAKGKGSMGLDRNETSDDPGGLATITNGGVTTDPRLFQSYVDRSLGQSDTFIDEFASAPLPHDLYINATKHIHIDLFRTCSSSGSQYAPRFDVVAYVEKDGVQRLLAGALESISKPAWDNDQYGHAGVGLPSQPPDPLGYCGVYFRLQSEIPVVPAGSVVRLRITQYDEYAFVPPSRIGTLDRHQSAIYLPLFPPEELVYRFPEFMGDPALAFANAGTAASSSTQRSPALAHGAGVGGAAGLLVAGLAAPFSGRRGRTALVAALFVAAALAGCVGPHGHAAAVNARTTAPTIGKGTSNVVRDTVGLAGTGDGTVFGTVHDETHVPLDGAFVDLLGTDNFTQTDRHGGFFFYHLQPGTYPLHVDAPGYASYQGTLQVRAASLTRVDIELPMLARLGQDQRSHVHDYWTARDEVMVKDQHVSFLLDPTSEGTTVWSSVPNPTRTQCTDSLVGGVGGFITGLGYGYCYASFVLRPNAGDNVWPTIIPGTGDLDITVNWDRGGSNTVPAVGLGFTSNRGDIDYTLLMPRGPGQPTHIATTWEMEDAGHQPSTTWRFLLYIPVPPGVSYAMDDSFTVTIARHKGVVPYEPAHPDPWKGKDTFVVKDTIEGCYQIRQDCPEGNQDQRPRCYADTSLVPAPYACRFTAGGPVLPRLVPLEARWLEVTLNQTYGTPSDDWTIHFKTAKDAMWSPDAKSVTPSGPGRQSSVPSSPWWRWIPYLVCVQDKEADTPYQRMTLWDMSVTDSKGRTNYDGLPFGKNVAVATGLSPDWPAEFGFKIVAHRDAPPAGVCPSG